MSCKDDLTGSGLQKPHDPTLEIWMQKHVWLVENKRRCIIGEVDVQQNLKKDLQPIPRPCKLFRATSLLVVDVDLRTPPPWSRSRVF